MKTNSQPLISVCIPVFNTEHFLAECLQSVISQDFEAFEIIVVNDASPGKDQNGLSCKKIVKRVQKECKRFRREKGLSPVNITYIENQINLQTIETRRILVEAAQGLYITMLDSDDQLLSGALTALYSAVASNDIVHGKMTLKAAEGQLSEKLEAMEKGINKQNSCLYGNQIIDAFLKQEHSGYLCGKLISRQLYLHAFSHIPFTKCVMADDYLIYFFIALEAKAYISINIPVYLYNIGLGISSNRKISTLGRWEQICSAANVFTAIFDELENLPPDTLSQEQIDRIRIACRHYLKNNLGQLENAVAPELQEAAKALLCDYWGSDFVEELEKN